MANNRFSAERVHRFCVNRWEFYKKQDGAYLPSKHDRQVFEDASKEFNLSASACEYWFNKVEKPLAEKKVREGIANGDFKKMCEEIMVGNGESPWGIEKILKDLYSIFTTINTFGLSRAYITVSKNDKEYCTSGHYLVEIGFSNDISISQRENGDIVLADDGNSGYVFEIGNIKSIICGICDSDNELVIAKNMFKLLMKNGNIVTMYFDFKDCDKAMSEEKIANYQMLNSCDPSIAESLLADYMETLGEVKEALSTFISEHPDKDMLVTVAVNDENVAKRHPFCNFRIGSEGRAISEDGTNLIVSSYEIASTLDDKSVIIPCSDIQDYRIVKRTGETENDIVADVMEIEFWNATIMELGFLNI